MADLARLLPVAVEKFPGGLTLEFLEEAQAAPLLRPLKETIVGDVGDVLWVLLGTVGIILLIACANAPSLSPLSTSRSSGKTSRARKCWAHAFG